MACNPAGGGRIPIHEMAKYLAIKEVGQAVRRNAHAKRFDPMDELLHVTKSLIEHYKNDCNARECLAASEHMRFVGWPANSGAAVAICTGCSTGFRLAAAYCSRSMGPHGLPPLQQESDECSGTAS